MKKYVISLKEEITRRDHIENEFKKHRVDFEFFDAVTPDNATLIAQQLQFKIDNKHLTDIELACLISHVQLWKKIINENIPYMAIFEDDVYLGEDASFYLNQSTWIDPKWDIIKIEKAASTTFLSKQRVLLPKGNRKLFKLKGQHLGMGGYILSKKGAKSFLEYISNNMLAAIDLMVFKDYIHDRKLPVYQMKPAICIQEIILHPARNQILPSNLDNQRQVRMKKNKTKGTAKIKKEIIRVIIQIRTAFFPKKMDFR